MIISCPHCGKRLQAKEQAMGRVLPCPTCKRPIDTNQAVEAAKLAPSTWFYMKEGWLKDEEVGPVSEDLFVSLVRTRKIKDLTVVRSPEFTQNQWKNFREIGFVAVEANHRRRREAARVAEEQRLQRENIRKENLDRLHSLVREVLADGKIDESEQQILDQFAATAQLSKSEIERIVKVEGKRLVDSIVQESLADGVYTPDEEATVHAISESLGIALQFDQDTADRIELSRLCWLFERCELDEFPVVEAPFKLQARETCYGHLQVEWNTIRQQSGAGRGNMSITPVGIGDAYITNKRVMFLADVQSKSITNASVLKIEGYTDGILLVRTSGGSVFMRYVESSPLENQKLALLMRRVCLTKPGAFRAAFPVSAFSASISPATDEGRFNGVAYRDSVVTAELVRDEPDEGDEPRFTFRVVGTNYGNRRHYVDRLTLGDPLRLSREPLNPADQYAVGVLDRSGNHLGYLKREVAEWFAPKMDRNEAFIATVYRLRDDGTLIAGVFEV